MKLARKVGLLPLSAEPPGQEKTAILRALLLLVVLLSVLFRLLYVFYAGFSWEDAFIHFRIAENLANGIGFVYNPGERVLVSSAPFWTLLISVFPAVGLSVEGGSKLVSILAEVGTILLLAYLARRYVGPWAGVFAAAIYGLNWSVVYWSTSGMETALFTFVTLLGVYLYVNKRYVWMAVACGLMMWVRPEGALMTILLLLLTLKGLGIREALKHGAIAVAVVTPWVVFAWAYFGSPVPNSLTAKAVIYGGTAGSFMRNYLIIRNSFIGDPVRDLATLIALTGLAVAVLRRAGPVLLLTAWMVLWYFAYWLSQTALFQWYLIPPYSVYGILAGIGLAFIASIATSWARIPSSLTEIGKAAGALMLVLLLVALIVRERHNVQKNKEAELNIRVYISEWIDKHTQDNEAIAIEGIGVVGYMTDRYILDLAGLASPQVLPYWERQTVPWWKNADVLVDILKDLRPPYYVRQSVVTPLSPQAREWLFQNYRPLAIATRNGVVEAQGQPKLFQSLLERMESPAISDSDVAEMKRYHIIYARISS
ncbi:MAG: glycosyltransferase family 39 protein [Chloroflexi bacterium]|nr:glycosyltransferase family 39 protein [Chloroflexota bacterium]